MRVYSRVLLFLLTCFVLIPFTSCTNDIKKEELPMASGSMEETNKTDRAAQIGSSNIDSIEFYSTTGYLNPDSGNNYGWQSELSFFGKVTGNFSGIKNEDILKKLEKFYGVSSLISEKNKEYLVSSADFLISGDDSGSREIQVRTICKDKIQNKTIITAIKIEENNVISEFPVGYYTVQPVNYAQTKECFMFENVIDLLDTASEDMVLTYRVAVPSKHPNTISFRAAISKDSNNISVEAMSWKYDDESTKDAKGYYATTKTASDIESFKIYAVDVRIKTKVKSAVIQPYVTVSYNGNSYNCMSEPVYFNLSRND